LQALERDGRMTNTELAGLVGLSASACLRRVQALEASGIIKGYRAVLDHGKLGAGFIAYVAVQLSRHTKEDQKRFEDHMRNVPQVLECHNTTGTIEYMLRVQAADLADYKRFHTEVLGTVPGVSGITSYIVMDSPIDRRG